jgi:hypothetical protein
LEIPNLNGTFKSLSGEKLQLLAKIPLSMHSKKSVQQVDKVSGWGFPFVQTGIQKKVVFLCGQHRKVGICTKA